MGFILFLLLFVSLAMSFLSIVYSLAIGGIILQSIFVIWSLYIVIRRIRKKKHFLGVTLVTVLHMGFLAIIFYVFTTIAVPNREEGDSENVLLGVKKYLYSTWGILKPEEEKVNIDDGFNRGVEDPMEWKEKDNYKENGQGNIEQRETEQTDIEKIDQEPSEPPN